MQYLKIKLKYFLGFNFSKKQFLHKFNLYKKTVTSKLICKSDLQKAWCSINKFLNQNNVVADNVDSSYCI